MSDLSFHSSREQGGAPLRRGTRLGSGAADLTADAPNEGSRTTGHRERALGCDGVDVVPHYFHTDGVDEEGDVEPRYCIGGYTNDPREYWTDHHNKYYIDNPSYTGGDEVPGFPCSNGSWSEWLATGEDAGSTVSKEVPSIDEMVGWGRQLLGF